MNHQQQVQNSTLAQPETVVALTESAAGQIRHMQVREQHPESKPLRIYVENGGCSGMRYGMTFDDLREGDFPTRAHGAMLVVDAQSAPFLKGSVLDFSDSLTGGGFKVLNPNARQSCGCGKSFEA